MFAAVSLELFRKREAGQPFFTRWFTHLMRAQCSLGEIDHEGVHFFVLRAPTDRWGLPDWDAVEQTVRRSGITRLLLPEGLRAPERLAPMVCDSTDYRRLYCLRVARHLARAAEIPPPQLCVGLLDLDGFSDRNLAMRALAFSGRVVVVTRSPAHFAELGKWASGEPGSPLTITDDLEQLGRCRLILAPFGVDGVCTRGAGAGGSAFDGLLVSAMPVPVSWPGPSVDSFSPVLPESLTALRPEGISALAFAAALWKEEGLAPLGRLPVGTVYSRGRALVPELISRQLRDAPAGDLPHRENPSEELPGKENTGDKLE